jgi:pilus assembly protein CpaF
VIQPTSRSFFSDDILMSIIERVLTPVGRRVDTSTPLVDARLPDGSRVNVVINPLSLVGPCMTIRKFGWVPFTMDDLVDRGTLSEPCAAFLQGCVVGRQNIIISGGTGSGKTTLLNVLGAYARPNERIITIEESAELKLPQPHVVGLEGRPANIEGKGAYTIRELVRNALRMRPDRIIVGEVRGPEALDMLQAMNTGHDGSLSTLHANTPADALKRLETLVLMAVDMPIRAIRDQILTAVDVVVQVARFADGRRRVTDISEVIEIDPKTNQLCLESIYTLRDPRQPRLRHTGYIPTFAEDMIERKQIGVEVFL